uniref:Uncharacterized protein n=1 Tax=Cyanistes caeruleus TaxID=156563 RepID=A0A8C0US54_CYACU
MAGCGMPVVCMPEPSISGWVNLQQRAGEPCREGRKPGMSEVWEGRSLPLPCFWLMSAGKWGEWEPWLKWSLLYGMSGVSGCTPCDGCTTGTLLDCKTQGWTGLRSHQDPPARRASALCSPAVASKAGNN